MFRLKKPRLTTEANKNLPRAPMDSMKDCWTTWTERPEILVSMTSRRLIKMERQPAISNLPMRRHHTMARERLTAATRKRLMMTGHLQMIKTRSKALRVLMLNRQLAVTNPLDLPLL
jgi:hypothetical protein